jgi:hypothetical protein
MKDRRKSRIIEMYEFGAMRVAGQVHHHDLKIVENRIIGDWLRRQGHLLCAEDIKDILGVGIDILVVGTGAYGGMEVSDGVAEAVSRRGIEFVAQPTKEAAETFNDFHNEGRRLAGAFHLTC